MPNIEFFSKVTTAEILVLDLNVKYTKQSFANRCYLNGPHKIERLVVPVLKGAKHQKMQDVEISYAENWQRRNWRTIENCYRKSPFFEYYEPYLQKVLLQERFDKLHSLNTETLSVCLKLLQSRTTICHENSTFDSVLELNYKEERQFTDDFTPQPYIQNFGSEFVPNLSVIDLLFCKGSESVGILNKSNLN